MVRATRGRALALGMLPAVVWFAWAPVSKAAGARDPADPPALARQILQATGVQGGLIVHLGSAGGQLTAALGASERYLVHGLDRDPQNVRRARDHIESLGLYGRVSVQRLDGKRLPYADNLANLVVAEQPPGVPMAELLRVLAPGGVAYVRENGRWAKTVKPWPDDIDEWTHWLHAADGNAVARDRVVGPPRHIQWAAAPLWSRHHDTVPSTSAMVSARGRLFYISDEAPACLDGSLPDKWFLVARDAFNGVLLWKRPISQWGWSQWNTAWRGRFNIPPQLPKRLVAAGDRVYATLGFNAPLSELDAATGEVLRVFQGTDNTDEILYQDGRLVLSLNHEARKPSDDDKSPVEKSVCALDADSGRMLWKQGSYTGLHAKYDAVEPFGRLEMAAGGDQVFLVDHDAIVSLDLGSGRRRWRAERPKVEEHLVMYNIRMSDQCVLVYQDGVVLFAQPEMVRKRSWHTLPGTLYAYRADDGQLLWKHPYGGWAHNWQPDVFVIDGLVWLHEHEDVPFSGHEITDKSAVDYAVIGLDLLTGRLERRFSTKKTFNVGHHHRCYRGKATERFLLPSRRGVEFLDLASGENHLHHWARGACLLGIVPANGLLYLAPHPCECYIAAKLNGYYALAPEGLSQSSRRENGTVPLPNQTTRGLPQSSRRENGTVPLPRREAVFQPPPSADWPTFRHDPLRSGRATSAVPTNLRQSWSAAVGGRLSPPVVAAGKLFVASIDEHRVAALDAADGTAIWSFTAGARIDTPPTICTFTVLPSGDRHGGSESASSGSRRPEDGTTKSLCLFGSADGWVYCLRADDGALAWRFRAAPHQRLVGACGQLESAWPVSGSVLVQNGVAYLAAGRSSYLDDGIFLYALDPITGEVLQKRVLYSPDPETGEMPPGDARTIPGALADVLVGDGASVYLRGQKVFDGAAGSQRGSENGSGAPLLSTAGFRDDTWFNRTRWTIGASAGAQLLVFDDQTAYGVSAYGGRNPAHSFQPDDGSYRLFADRWKPAPTRKPADDDKKKKSSKRKAPPPLWETRVPVRDTAMVIAGRTLVVAGPPAAVDPQDPLAAFEGRKGGKLWLLAAADGEKLAEYPLDSPPVFDGMAAAAGRIYVSTYDGRVVCLAGR